GVEARENAGERLVRFDRRVRNRRSHAHQKDGETEQDVDDFGIHCLAEGVFQNRDELTHRSSPPTARALRFRLRSTPGSAPSTVARNASSSDCFFSTRCRKERPFSTIAFTAASIDCPSDVNDTSKRSSFSGMGKTLKPSLMMASAGNCWPGATATS